MASSNEVIARRSSSSNAVAPAITSGTTSVDGWESDALVRAMMATPMWTVVSAARAAYHDHTLWTEPRLMLTSIYDSMRICLRAHMFMCVYVSMDICT